MNNIKNVAVVGHSSKGKTTLCEAMLNVSKVTERMGRIADSNTVSDFDAEEKKRKISISSSVLQFDYQSTKMILLTLPVCSILLSVQMKD